MNKDKEILGRNKRIGYYDNDGNMVGWKRVEENKKENSK